LDLSYSNSPVRPIHYHRHRPAASDSFVYRRQRHRIVQRRRDAHPPTPALAQLAVLLAVFPQAAAALHPITAAAACQLAPLPVLSLAPSSSPYSFSVSSHSVVVSGERPRNRQRTRLPNRPVPTLSTVIHNWKKVRSKWLTKLTTTIRLIWRVRRLNHLPNNQTITHTQKPVQNLVSDVLYIFCLLHLIFSFNFLCFWCVIIGVVFWLAFYSRRA